MVAPADRSGSDFRQEDSCHHSGYQSRFGPQRIVQHVGRYIQLTDGDNIVKPIWLSADNTDKEVAGEPYGKLVGVESLNLKVDDDEVSVQPANKMLTSWGKMKTLW